MSNDDSTTHLLLASFRPSGASIQRQLTAVWCQFSSWRPAGPRSPARSPCAASRSRLVSWSRSVATAAFPGTGRPEPVGRGGSTACRPGSARRLAGRVGCGRESRAPRTKGGNRTSVIVHNRLCGAEAKTRGDAPSGPSLTHNF